MTISACVVYHSGYGHTKKQAEAVFDGLGEVDGVKATLVPVEDLASPDAESWATLDRPIWDHRLPA